MANAPGTAFNYNTGNAHLLSAILSKVTGTSAAEFATQRLFKPLGISDVVWTADPQGISDGGSGLTMHPRDMAVGRNTDLIVVLPQLDMVAVVTGKEQFRFSVLVKFLEAAAVSDQALPTNPNAYAELTHVVRAASTAMRTP